VEKFTTLYNSAPPNPTHPTDKTRQDNDETDAGANASVSISFLHTKLITELNFNITF